jgi:hypothetical protein
MGKSKHRKNHKQKLNKYKTELREGARTHVKFLMEQREKLIQQLNMIGGQPTLHDTVVEDAQNS